MGGGVGNEVESAKETVKTMFGVAMSPINIELPTLEDLRDG